MPLIQIPLTDLQLKMLAWAASTRKMTTSELLIATLAEIMNNLASTFAAAHKAEAASLFAALPPEKQLEVLDVLRTAKDS